MTGCLFYIWVTLVDSVSLDRIWNPSSKWRVLMSDVQKPGLDGVSETLLLTLYIRAQESLRPDALLKDEKAVALVNQMDYDFSSRFSKLRIDEGDKLAIILRNREFDCQAREFMAANPRGIVVHIGCGLDARYERVDNGQVEWYDLDLPDVIDLRRSLISEEGPRYHFLPYSAFDEAWLDLISGQPILFLAEGVFMYFEKARVRSLILMVRDRFPGAELVFDAFSPYIVRANNLRFRIARTKISACYYWGLKSGTEVESWGEGICMLDRWGIFDRPEPRLPYPEWARHIPVFANAMRIFRYRLGKLEE
jgi:O-methyltransferase involved in polyketide biosynthesis